MRKALCYAICIIIGLAMLMVTYGFYLNYSSEKNIAQQISNSRTRLEGIRVHSAVVSASWEVPSLRLEAENMTDVISRNSGTLEEVYVKQNQKVVKNQPLARVLGEDLDVKIKQLEADIARAVTSRNRYALSLERYEKLLGSGAISLEKYDDIKAQYEGSVSEVKAMELQKEQYELMRERLIIKAPMDGTIVMIYKKPGAFISEGTPVVMVGDFSHLIFKEDMEDRRAESLLPLEQNWVLKFAAEDLKRIFESKYNKENKGADESFTAKVIEIDPPMAVNAGMRTITWSVDNSSGMLEPKRYQRTKFEATSKHSGKLIPYSALDKQTQSTVLVWNQEKKLERRKVVLGARVNSYIEIVDGLKENEIVITSDQIGLKVGQQVDVVVKESKDGK